MFVAFLLNCNWQEFDSSSDPDTLWDVFELNIRESLDKICPIKQIKVPITRPKWLINEIVSLMRDRDKMFSHARRTNNQDSWNMARFLRNWVEMAIIKTKSNTQLNESKNNPKRFWRSIREVLPQRNTSIIKPLIDTKNNSKIEKDRLPSFINTFFANIGHNLAQPLLMKHPVSAQPVRVDGNFDLF